MSSKNIKHIFDQYNEEEYLCTRTKPRGMLLCGYCNEPYIPETYESETVDGYEIQMTVCSNCGEVSFPYEED